MGTRADFYSGRGKDAVWLGSITWNGNPSGISEAIFNAHIGFDYRYEVATFFAHRDDVTFASEFWPWPWKDSSTTDYAYAFEDGTVYASNFGGPWFEVLPNAEDGQYGEPEDDAPGEKPVFPDMTKRMGTFRQIMGRSGQIAFYPDGE